MGYLLAKAAHVGRGLESVVFLGHFFRGPDEIVSYALVVPFNIRAQGIALSPQKAGSGTQQAGEPSAGDCNSSHNESVHVEPPFHRRDQSREDDGPFIE